MTAAHLDHDGHNLDVVDMIDELVDARRVREKVERDPDAHGTRIVTWHRVRVPSLLDQLDETAPGGDRTASQAGFDSRPAAHIDALAALVDIERGTNRWLNRYDVDHGDWDLDACVRRLGALMAGRMQRCTRRTAAVDKPTQQVTCCHWHDAARDVRRWWARARIVTGWDQPAWRPDATCPNCGTRGSLGVRLAERVATCVECHEGWDPSSYQELAEHVRDESLARARAGRPMPCAPVPGYDPPMVMVVAEDGRERQTRLVQCPACGSARCQRAVASRPVVELEAS